MIKILPTINHLFKLKIIRFIVIPLFLLFLWGALSFLFLPHHSFTTVTQKFSIDKNKLPIKKFAQEYKIKSEFKAEYSHLGSISIHQSIITDHLESTDRLIFHIREKGKDNWYFEAIYDNGFFNGHKYFPFGFPIINDSKGKTYEFEVISTFSVDNVDISKNNPHYIVLYQYTPKEMINSGELREELLKKLASNLLDKQFLVYSSIFLLPLFLYLFYLFHPHTFYLELREFPKDQILLGFIFLFIIYDVVFISTLMYGIFLGQLLLLSIYYIKNKVPRQISLVLTFIFFLLSEMFIIFGSKSQLDKSSIWLYVFFNIFLVQILLDFKRGNLAKQP